jgi:EpsI family protein
MNTLTHYWPRFALLLAVLLATFGLLNARNRREILPAHAPLRDFPLALNGWEGKNLQIDPQNRKVLGPGDYLARDYFDPSQSEVVNLFIAFFPSQRQGDTIHSPRNCLPGSGWLPVESRYLQIAGPSGRDIKVNRYIVQKENQKALVLYWYQAHDHFTPSEYLAKYYLVADAISMNRSDGALVRLTTLVRPSEDMSSAEGRVIRFAGQVLPLLDGYIPR